LISYLFPPAGGVAVQRALSLARYLPLHGFRVFVLSAANPAVAQMDPSLARQIPGNVSVSRTFAPGVPFAWRKRAWDLLSGGKAAAAPAKAGAPPKSGGLKSSLVRGVRRVLCPDPEIVWKPFALRRARRLIVEHGIGTVLVTAPPFSSFLIANRLKREYPGLVVAADFRDEWLEFYLSTFDFHGGEDIARRARRMERETVESASLVVSVTDSIVGKLRRRYPDQPAEKFACVLNGYDPASFADFRPRAHGTGRVVVTYAGTLYSASSARYYLDGLDRLPEELRARVETRFIGRIAPEERPHLENRSTAISELGFLPQREAFRKLEETDYLLLTMTDAGSLTGKLFEYLATGKPILAFAPRGGEVERILRETGAGWCADPGDAEEAGRMLERALRGGAVPARNEEAVRRYDRQSQAAEYARLLGRAAGTEERGGR
jgi:glycosyltransferase involved in cell wall biosynthesis